MRPDVANQRISSRRLRGLYHDLDADRIAKALQHCNLAHAPNDDPYSDDDCRALAEEIVRGDRINRGLSA